MLVFFEVNGTWFVLRQDGACKRQGQFLFRKNWKIKGFVCRNGDDDVQAVPVSQLFETLATEEDIEVRKLRGAVPIPHDPHQAPFAQQVPISYAYLRKK
ncbi:hypothetical protein HQ520_10360 [bacterium]|nr:hypothetical protein [bacterium]